MPFSGVTVTDPNSSAIDTLGIDVQGYGTLSGNGLNNPIGSYYTLTGTAAELTKNLAARTFTPTAGPHDTGFTANLVLSLGGLDDRNTRVFNFDPPVPPTITGTKGGQVTAAEAAVTPFAGVTITDPNRQNASAQYTNVFGPFNLYNNTLTIALGGAGGMLSGDGLTQDNGGDYTLTGDAYTLTKELDALRFTPAGVGTPGSQAATTFTLTDTSIGLSTSDSTTVVTDVLPADSIMVDPTVTAQGYGAFTITGRASSTAGVNQVEISALVNGQNQDLGAATLNPDGTFSFTDQVGATSQSFITATQYDGAGGVASAGATFDLTAGIRGEPYAAEQDSYEPSTNALTGQTFFRRDGSVQGTTSYASDGTQLISTTNRPNGSHFVLVSAPEQTVQSDFFDTFDANGQGSTSFVFDPGYGHDVVRGFGVGNDGHDTLDLPSSDFTGIADVLRHTQQTAGGVVIHDPTSGDTIRLAGVSKIELIHNKQDFSFHT